MKIIDLLNMAARGEELPKKIEIKWQGDSSSPKSCTMPFSSICVFDNKQEDYAFLEDYGERYDYLFEGFRPFSQKFLNYEVEEVK